MCSIHAVALHPVFQITVSTTSHFERPNSRPKTSLEVKLMSPKKSLQRAHTFRIIT